MPVGARKAQIFFDCGASTGNVYATTAATVIGECNNGGVQSDFSTAISNVTSMIYVARSNASLSAFINGYE